MKKIKRILSIFMVIFIFFECNNLPVKAADTDNRWSPEYRLSASPNYLKAGQKTTIKLRVSNYYETDLEISGIQADISGFDNYMFDISQVRTLIDSNTALTNKGAYKSNSKTLTFLYYEMTESLSKDSRYIMEFDVTPYEDVSQEYLNNVEISIRFRTTLRGTEDKKRDETKIFHLGDAECEPEDDIKSITIDFGSLEYTYRQGLWDPEKHEYGKGSFSCNAGENLIKVTGNDVKVSFTYKPVNNSLIEGIFTSKSGEKINTLLSGSDNQVEALLKLSGELTDNSGDYVKVGTVVVTVEDQED